MPRGKSMWDKPPSPSESSSSHSRSRSRSPSPVILSPESNWGDFAYLRSMANKDSQPVDTVVLHTTKPVTSTQWKRHPLVMQFVYINGQKRLIFTKNAKVRCKPKHTSTSV